MYYAVIHTIGVSGAKRRYDISAEFVFGRNNDGLVVGHSWLHTVEPAPRSRPSSLSTRLCLRRPHYTVGLSLRLRGGR